MNAEKRWLTCDINVAGALVVWVDDQKHPWL